MPILLALLLCLVPLRAEDLVVSAASSLGPALRALVPAFEARHPGVKVRLNLGASDALVAQVKAGAPVDLLACADEISLDRAAAHLVPGTRRILARGALVLVAPATGRLPGSLQDLMDPTFRRIVLGNPATVPVGRYGREALEVAGLWDALQPRIFFATTARQALDLVARGEVDAGILFATDARSAPGRVRQGPGLATRQPIAYPVALVREGAAARAFLAHLASREAQGTLAGHGFQCP